MNFRRFSKEGYFPPAKRYFISLAILALMIAISAAAVLNIVHILDRVFAPQHLANNTEKIALSADLQTLDLEKQEMLSSSLSSSSEESIEKNQDDDEARFDKIVISSKDDQLTGIGPKTASTNLVQNPEVVADLEAEIKLPKVKQLILPSIAITSTIVDVPIISGNWDISQLDQDAGILEGFKKHPEGSGPLVIVAHATTQWPTAGPFANLQLMSLGDPIILKIEDTEYLYELSRFLIVDTTNVGVLNKNGEDGIVLVTCGNYNSLTGLYGSRLVAYGNLRETRPEAPEINN
ncbi:MAG: LPXTG-site transpeptidase (sortase) family protein [Cellvibrionaceae bacterium]|jgi:LPXTG-site transpeptidase (sortase) family protein